jgi:site-specific DNA-methyltransferase (adenine-specific)
MSGKGTKLIETENSQVYFGSNLDVLPTLPDNSVDSIITDPPYELGFMGKSWDSSGIAYNVELWKECLRVLKPGGHLLAFSGSRTYHRMTVAIEDAGFEVRDMIAWISNKTFPKSHNLKGDWEGWGTGLKPTVEPIVMARKQLIGTVAQNVLEHGTGGLNIDGSRIEGNKPSKPQPSFGVSKGVYEFGSGKGRNGDMSDNTQGRWPANLILDEYSAEILDEQSGQLHGSGNKSDVAKGNDKSYDSTSYEISYKGRANRDYGSKGGGASRFFYVARASKADRSEGLETENNHPTVKPTALMTYLINLVTPPNGTVLDPFTGSGSTGKAAILAGFNFIGIELTEDYYQIIEGRLKDAEAKLTENKDKEGEVLF